MLALALVSAGAGTSSTSSLRTHAGPLAQRVPPTVQLVDLGARGSRPAIVPRRQYLRRTRPAAVIAAKDHANLAALAASQLADTHARR